MKNYKKFMPVEDFIEKIVQRMYEIESMNVEIYGVLVSVRDYCKICTSRLGGIYTSTMYFHLGPNGIFKILGKEVIRSYDIQDGSFKICI